MIVVQVTGNKRSLWHWLVTLQSCWWSVMVAFLTQALNSFMTVQISCYC